MNRITLPSSLRFLAWIPAAALALLPACGGTVEVPDVDGPTSSTASVRFAHLSSKLAPFDVCAGTDGEALLATDGLAQGLQFGDVSRYLDAAPPGAAWTLVPVGASCSDPAGVSLSIAW